MLRLSIVSVLVLFFSCQMGTRQAIKYPDYWWAPISDSKVPAWEILPQAGKKNVSVILSKRHELGLLSNFAPTPFFLNGKQYASVEGLWQSTKYPDPKMKNDPRLNCKQFKLIRAQVEQMSSFDAKAAGDPGSECMKQLNIDWVSYDGQQLIYREKERGAFFELIYSAMKAKLEQNPTVEEVLLKTQGLKLLPDHHTKVDDPPAWRYFEIWQEMRDQPIQKLEVE